MASLEEELKTLGADTVATPENVREQVKAAGMPAPKLALNCVGGESATTLSKMLMPGGTIVTYGGMSMKPVSIPTPVLIFKDIKVRALRLQLQPAYLVHICMCVWIFFSDLVSFEGHVL